MQGRFTSGLQGLLTGLHSAEISNWPDELAELCTAKVYVNDEKQPIIFRARPVRELLVHHEGEGTNLHGAWNIFRHDDEAKQSSIALPADNVRGFLIHIQEELLPRPGVKIVEPLCLPLAIADEVDQPCVDPTKLAMLSPATSQSRIPPECVAPTENHARDVIGLPRLLKSPAKQAVLVAVMDKGFDDLAKIQEALTVARLRQADGNESIVNGWNYCLNNSDITGSAHGSEIGSLIAADCGASAEKGHRPGVAQNAQIFAMKLFYRSSGSNEFAGPLAMARAIRDAREMGARVVNMSISWEPGNEDGWSSVPSEMRRSPKITFVTGPSLQVDEPPYPMRLGLSNMLLVGERRRTPGNKWIAYNKFSNLDVDAPNSGRSTYGGTSPGVSNSIAYVSGAVAALLGRANCSDVLSPENVKDMLIAKAWSPYYDEEDDEPLLKVGFIADHGCEQPR